MFASVTSYLASTSLGKLVTKKIWNTPEGILDLICELDEQFYRVNNAGARGRAFDDYKKELLDNLKKLNQEELDHLYDRFESMRKYAAIGRNLLVRVIEDYDEMLVNFLITENCCYLNNDFLSAVLKSADAKNDNKIIQCLADAIAVKLCAGRKVVIEDYAWKRRITQSICDTYYRLFNGTEAISAELLQQKAWSLLAIVAKAKALQNRVKVPESVNDALAEFLAVHPITEESYISLLLGANNQEEDDCIEKVDAIAKAIIQRMPKPQRKSIQTRSSASLVSPRPNLYENSAIIEEEHKSSGNSFNHRNATDAINLIGDASSPPSPRPVASLPKFLNLVSPATSTGISTASSSSLRKRTNAAKFTIKQLPL